MKKDFFTQQMRLFHQKKSLSRSLFNTAPPTIQRLRELHDSPDVRNLNPTDDLPESVMTALKAILEQNKETDDLTLEIVTNFKPLIAFDERINEIKNTSFTLKRPQLNLPRFINHYPRLAAPDVRTPDIDLNHDMKTFHVDELFFGKPEIETTYYHLGTYTKATLTENGMSVTAEEEFEPIEIPSKKVIAKSKLSDNQYLACVNLLNNDQWQTLPGVASDQEIPHLKVQDGTYTLRRGKITNKVQIKFAPLTNTDQKEITVLYNVNAKPQPLPELALDSVDLEHFFQALANNQPEILKDHEPAMQCAILSRFFNSFTNTFPDGYQKPASKKQQWLDLLKHRMGVCEHRSTWFLNFAERLGLSAQMKTSQSHAFHVVKLNGQYFTLDLGGKPCHTMKKINFNQAVFDLEQANVNCATLQRSTIPRFTELSFLTDLGTTTRFSSTFEIPTLTVEPLPTLYLREFELPELALSTIDPGLSQFKSLLFLTARRDGASSTKLPKAPTLQTDATSSFTLGGTRED